MGRTVELGLLNRAIVEGTSVLVSGPPGVGKTRLVNEALGRLETAEFAVFRIRCVDSIIPFGALLGLLDLEVSPISDPTEVALRVRAAIRASIREAGDDVRRRPVLSVDDAQRADPSTAALLAQLADEASCAIVLAAADNEKLPDPLVRMIARSEVARFDLAPMDDIAASALVRQVLGGEVERWNVLH